MRVLVYNELDPKRITGFDKVRRTLEAERFDQADVRKIGDNLYRARLNRQDRLLFQLYRAQGETCCLILEHIRNHAYHKSRFLRGAVVMGAYYTHERAEEFYYSNPVYSEEIGLIALPEIDIRSYNSLHDLTGYTIGHGRGFAHSEEFDGADYLDKEPEDDLHLNVRKLFAGRIDMVAGGIPRLAQVLSEEGYDINRDVVILEPSLSSNPMHNMISRNHLRGEEIMADFNRGLRSIMRDGVYEDILYELGFPVPELSEDAAWADGYGPEDLYSQ